MNYGISVIFRAIPVAMALFCFFYGGLIYLWGSDASRLTAGPVIFFLGSICLALYATAATIIRQIIGTYNDYARYFLPIMAYCLALFTFVMGVLMFRDAMIPEFFVAGHVVAGLGMITACVATAATASTRFALIPKNSAMPLSHDREVVPNPQGFTLNQELMLEGFVSFVAAVAWAWTIILFSNAGAPGYFVAGSVMGGIACVCTSLIALVASIARQVRNSYGEWEKKAWSNLVLTMGIGAMVWGVLVIVFHWWDTTDFVGFILIGLGLICLSISSKVILLARVWRADFPMAARIPLIPVVTALVCLFIAAFLFEEALYKPKFFVPARVLVGFGAICFTLFSIVSILESGAKKA